MYSISKEDIIAYLSGLIDDDEVGEPNSMNYCLVAESLKYKYPEAYSYVHEFNDGASVDGEDVEFPDEVYQIADAFDGLIEVAPVTKEILRVHMPELFAGEVSNA